MQLLPVPMTDEHLQRTAQHWLRFLPAIAKRSKEPIRTLFANVMQKDVQPFLIWDEALQCAVAMLGVAYKKRGDDLIGELIWTTGSRRKDWEHLLPELERYLKEHIGCVAIRPICRPGWKPFLKQRGYRETHVTMEKVL